MEGLALQLLEVGVSRNIIDEERLLAVTVMGPRIAPVFDVARQVKLLWIREGRVVMEKDETFRDEHPMDRAMHLARLNVSTVLCGAISRPMQAMVESQEIEVIPFVAGDFREIVEAFISGRLFYDLFAMPGCRRHRRPRFGGGNSNFREETMNGMGNRGGGGGSGRGRGGGRGMGRMGGKAAAGPVGDCLCPRCGYREAHEQGVPCTQKQCPNCQVPLVRK